MQDFQSTLDLLTLFNLIAHVVIRLLHNNRSGDFKRYMNLKYCNFVRCKSEVTGLRNAALTVRYFQLILRETLGKTWNYFI